MYSKWDSVLQDIWIKSRFTSYFYQSVHFVDDEAIPTLSLMTVTSGLRLHYNPVFIEGYTNDELIGLLVHEMMHIMLNHNHRMVSANDVLLQNLAQDMVINSYIFENRNRFFSRTGRDRIDEPPVVLPAGLPLIPEKFYTSQQDASAKYDPAWEDVYRWLAENKNETITDVTDGSETCASIDSRFEMPDFSVAKKGDSEITPDFFNSDDGVIFNDENDNPLPAGVHLFRESSLDDTTMSIKKRVVGFAERDENATAERLYQEISILINKKRPAKINSLNKMIRRFLNHALCAEDWDFSSRRFNRRYFGQGIYAPGRVYEKRPAITVAIDVSGSMIMKPEEIEKAFGAVESILNRYTVHLLCIDEDVFVPRKSEKGFIAAEDQTEQYTYHKGDWRYIRTASNAATFFEPLFDRFTTEQKEPLIIITDGEVYDMDRLKPYKNTLWAVPVSCEKTLQPPFGKVAVIE